MLVRAPAHSPKPTGHDGHRKAWILPTMPVPAVDRDCRAVAAAFLEKGSTFMGLSTETAPCHSRPFAQEVCWLAHDRRQPALHSLIVHKDEAEDAHAHTHTHTHTRARAHAHNNELSTGGTYEPPWLDIALTAGSWTADICG